MRVAMRRKSMIDEMVAVLKEEQDSLFSSLDFYSCLGLRGPLSGRVRHQHFTHLGTSRASSVDTRECNLLDAHQRPRMVERVEGANISPMKKASPSESR